MANTSDAAKTACFKASEACLSLPLQACVLIWNAEVISHQRSSVQSSMAFSESIPIVNLSFSSIRIIFESIDFWNGLAPARRPGRAAASNLKWHSDRVLARQLSSGTLGHAI